MKSFYLVGGFVRSLFTGERTKDIDICVTGTSYEALLEFLLENKVQVLVPQPQYHHLFFCQSAYQMPDDSNTTSWKMGRITAKIETQVVDFLLARKELDADYTQKNVVPVSVVNTPDVTILEDLARRDFTMNAMAIPVEFCNIEWWANFNNPKRNKGEWLTDHFTNVLDNLIDPYHGRQHIEEKWIHTVGSAFDRFSADPTRILRALKFALRLGMQLSENIQSTLNYYEDLYYTYPENTLSALYRSKVNPDRSCNELQQVFAQAPSWQVLEVIDRYIPPSLVKTILCDSKIKLYPSLRST